MSYTFFTKTNTFTSLRLLFMCALRSHGLNDGALTKPKAIHKNILKRTRNLWPPEGMFPKNGSETMAGWNLV